jgi:hypothetical protein
MPQPRTPLKDAVFPIELFASMPEADSGDYISRVRWRDRDGNEGQSSIGAIVRLVDHGAVVTVAGNPTRVVEVGKCRFIVVDASDAPIRKLPGW